MRLVVLIVLTALVADSLQVLAQEQAEELTRPTENPVELPDVPDDKLSETQLVDHATQSARSRFRISELFKFTKYKQIFHKTYSSVLEESIRLAYFMTRALRAVASAIGYKHSDSSYYLAINKLSDRSPIELARMTNRVVLEASEVGKRGLEQLVPGGLNSTDKQPEVVQPEHVGLHPLSRRKRGLFGGKSATLAGPYKKIEWTMTIMGKPAASSSGSGRDEVFVDHRTGGCLSEPRRQSSCGSCYAFSAIAYFEWLHCKQTRGREMATFSEQYIIDCGPGRLSGLGGCRGGGVTAVGDFVLNFGLESLRDYPYKNRDDLGCPYDNDAPLKSAGAVRWSKLGHGSPVHMDLWPDYLRRAPMLVLMSAEGQPGFMEYGGGVYDGARCHPTRTDHNVLLVGHGREDGQEYWLLRNSYGPDWGEGGYMKLSKRARCISPPAGYMFGTRDGGRKFEAQPKRNKRHNRQALI